MVYTLRQRPVIVNNNNNNGNQYNDDDTTEDVHVKPKRQTRKPKRKPKRKPVVAAVHKSTPPPQQQQPNVDNEDRLRVLEERLRRLESEFEHFKQDALLGESPLDQMDMNAPNFYAFLKLPPLTSPTTCYHKITELIRTCQSVLPRKTLMFLQFLTMIFKDVDRTVRYNEILSKDAYPPHGSPDLINYSAMQKFITKQTDILCL
jgi:hypothetical protein